MIQAPADEIGAYLDRAHSSAEAARHVVTARYYDFAASRPYYAAFYAAAALFLHSGKTYSRHSAVIAAVHRDYVRQGRLTVQRGRELNWLFELRATGDYSITAHVSKDDAESAIAAAEGFLTDAKSLVA